MKRTLALAAALTALLATPLARAETRAEAEAGNAMRRGMRAFDRGDMEAALSEFRSAQSLVPSANRPYRESGAALERLGRYEESIAAYEHYLALNPLVNDGDLVRSRVAEIRKNQLEAELDVVSEPAGGAISLDGKPSGTSPAHLEHLSAGKHLVSLRLEGFGETQREVSLTAGSKAVVRFVLPQATVGERKPLDPPPSTVKPTRASGGNSRKTAGLVVGATGLAIVGASLVVDLTILNGKWSDFESARKAGRDDAAGLLSSARAWQTGLTIGYVSGAVVALTGATIFLWPSSKSTGLSFGPASLRYSAEF